MNYNQSSNSDVNLKTTALVLVIALQKEASECRVLITTDTAVTFWLHVHLTTGRTRRDEHVRRVRIGLWVISPSPGIHCAVYVQCARRLITFCAEEAEGEGVGAAVGADEDAVVSLVVAAQVA